MEQTLPADPARKRGLAKRRTRSRAGCVNCRQKKKKCDESKPTCSTCKKHAERCNWIRPLSFLPQHALTIDGASRPTTPSAHSRLAHNSTPEEEHDDTNSVYGAAMEGNAVSVAESHEIPSLGPPELLVSSFQSSRPNQHTDLLQKNLDQTQIALDLLNPSQGHYPEIPAADGILANNEMDIQLSPDTTTDDGVFLPGSTYRALHNALRNQVFIIAQSAQASREVSPSAVANEILQQVAQPLSTFRLANASGAEEISGTNIVLTPQQEYILWKNWIDEISAWIDKHDPHKHFRHTLPFMAQKCSHLRFAMLALSARHLERRDGSFPAVTTLALYQEAIHQLLPELHSKDISVVASCVVLCVLEMFSCSPKVWRRHLDGCASLIRVMNIRGDSGGVEQALFWCFARMDVSGGLISTERTLIPIDQWLSTASFEVLFHTPRNFEDHANYACYIVAQVLDFLFDSPKQRRQDLSNETYATHQHNFTEKWERLFDHIDQWRESRPMQMQELLFQRSQMETDKQSSPFPTVLYGNAAAASGNQMYHTAALLMLQKIPNKVPRRSRSMLWHARQICAIAISNTYHGCWQNGIQPLWLAGQLMSHPSEHRALVEIYERIERETGWGATWRVNDLKEHWGNLD